MLLWGRFKAKKVLSFRGGSFGFSFVEPMKQQTIPRRREYTNCPEIIV